MASNDARVGRLQRRLVEKIIRGTHRPNRRLASTSRMRTALSPIGSGSYGQPVHRLPWLIGAH